LQKQVWNINKLLTWAIDYFKTKDIPNPRLSAELLLSSVLNLSRMELYLKYDYILNEQQLKKYKEFILRRLEHEPIQYITEEAYFRKIKLKVNKNVLIPRPETELVVEKAKEAIKEIINFKNDKKKNKVKNQIDNKIDNNINIIDVGVGSGAISISLLYEYDENSNENNNYYLNIIATDISKEAIEVASQNAKSILNPSKNEHLSFIECDVICDNDSDFVNNYLGNIDLIISNPPYIAKKDYENLNKEVKNFEPEIALNAGDEGIESYQHIIKKIKSFLNPNFSFIIFEIDPKISLKLQELIKTELPLALIRVEKDYNNFDRILIAKIIS
jgi:release factor glutamine methyltransferase